MATLFPEDEYHPFETKFYSQDALREYFGDSLDEAEPVLEYLLYRYNAKTLREERPYDVVFYGATGYTGRLVLQYLKDRYTDKPADFSFALAGRNAAKLEAVRDEYFAGTPFADVPVEAAPMDHMWSLKQLVNKCRCIVDLAGPFLTSGAEALVEACIIYECDYVDVNGELPFTHNLTRLHDQAKYNRVMVVPNSAMAGGLPDIVTHVAATALRERHGEDVRRVVAYVQMSDYNAMAPSGGTLATRAAMANAPAEVKALMGDPFALGGRVAGDREEDSDRTLMTVAQDPLGWRAPYNYAFMETRVVRRSNALHLLLGGQNYGPQFNYQEYSLWPTEAAAREAKERAGSVKKEEEDLKKGGRYYAQGEGPSLQDRDSSKCIFTAVATTESGKEVRATLETRDGYYETAHIAVEVALCLLKERARLPYGSKGGVLTPSVACGSVLVDRLVATGMTLTVV
eukprot:EG_transcript_5435